MSKIAGSSFSISVRGHISHAELPMLRGMDLMCKYSYEIGSDWVVAAGLEEGFSQVDRAGFAARESWNLTVHWKFGTLLPKCSISSSVQLLTVFYFDYKL